MVCKSQSYIILVFVKKIFNITPMKVSVEISMYPLSQEYIPLIKGFLKRLRAHKNITVETNGMSSQIFGLFDDVFGAINQEMKEEFAKSDKVVYVMKCINSHLQKEK